MRHDPSAALEWINNGVDTVFACDMILQFFLGYVDEEIHATVYNQTMIAKRYVRTWFFLDLISVFPFSYVAQNMPFLSKLRAVRLIKLSKLVKLTRIARLLRGTTSDFLDLFKYIFLIVCLLHWTACLWNLLAQLEADYGMVTWEDSEGVRDAQQGVINRYLWSVVVCTPRAHRTSNYAADSAAAACLRAGAWSLLYSQWSSVTVGRTR